MTDGSLCGTHAPLDLSGVESLGDVSLAIPAWQMAMFVAIISVFLLFRRLRLCLLVNYVFVLYWGFVLYAPDFVGAAAGDTTALAVYILCGLAIVTLAIIAFVHEAA